MIKTSNDDFNNNEQRIRNNSFETLSNFIKIEDKNILQSKINFDEGKKDLNNYQENFQYQIDSFGQNNLSEENKNQKLYLYSKSNTNSLSLPPPLFNYSSSISNNESHSNYSSYDSISKSLTIKSPLKQTTTSISNQNLYQPMQNSAAADAAAAIFQAYSQLNNRTTGTIPSIIHQQSNNQQQQQIRK